jgi:hypothetical protein
MFEYQEILNYTMEFMKLEKAHIIVVDRMMDAKANITQFDMTQKLVLI